MDRGKGVPKEREVNRRREVFEDYRNVIDVEVDTQDCGLVLVRMFHSQVDDVKVKTTLCKVRWRGYDRTDDTWEPITPLCRCVIGSIIGQVKVR